MLQLTVHFLLCHWSLISWLLLNVYLLRNRYHHGLNRYPGPLLASLTDWWRFFDVLGRRPDITHIRLHKQHGDVVRLGPNVLSFADPKALKTIYGLNKGFIKSEFYPVQQAVSNGKRLRSLFSTTDEDYHAALRRTVNSAFSMSSLVQYEHLVESTTEVFLDQTDKVYAAKGVVCDFAQWLQFYAFDVIGEITYSKRHGFVERVEDIDGIVAYLGWMFSYVGPVGQVPSLDLLFLKNPVLNLLDKWGIKSSTFPVAKFAQDRMTERLSEKRCNLDTGQAEGGCTDLLSKFLQAKKDHPKIMDDGKVLTMATSMAFAGSETTAIGLSAVFYYLLKHPTCYRKLMKELDTAVETSNIEHRPNRTVSWAESQNLPYLDSCIKEAFRLHPAVGLPLERVVPAQGAEICGERIPGGTIVGCSAWVIHRRKEVFGEDADLYRPERWLIEHEESIEKGKERIKDMNGTMFHFGMGARTCIGKNISLLEIYKLVPSFLRRFEVQLANREKEWRLHNAWFVKPLDFKTTFRRRTTP